MRKSLIKTLLLVLGATAMMAPGARYLSAQQTQQANDAEHVIRPMVELLRESPVYHAQTAVEPLMDIEAVWEIEDTRRQAQEPLVAGMRNGLREMGQDSASRTFFCTLGLDLQEGDPWPQLELYAQGSAEEIRVGLVDDYTYDDCQDAIINGYAYQLIAYTQEEYEYISIVFTGYPTVSIHTREPIVVGDDYIAARISIADAQQAYSLVEMGKIHQRENHWGTGKLGYRMEFHELSATGRDKRKDVSVLGMEADTDWLLVSNIQDETRMHNRLGFDLWKRWHEGKDTINKLDGRMVEVFVQDAYAGMYQLLERVDPAEQIEKAGGNPQTDMMVRKRVYEPSRPGINANETNNFRIIYEYEASGNADRAFAQMQDYLRLTSVTEPLEDEAFVELASRCVDVENLMRYYLFIQAMGVTVDNSLNNLYIWIAFDGERYVYRFGPWDMDSGAYGVEYQADGSMYHWFDLNLVLARRLLDLNALGSREMIWSLWRDMRSTVFSDGEIERWVMDAQDEVYRSGAYLRESEKWMDGAQLLYMDRFLEYALTQPQVIEEELSARWPVEP